MLNKLYVDTKLPILTNQGCDFQQFKSINVADPINNTDVVNNQTMFRRMRNYKKEAERYYNQQIHYTKNTNGLDFKKLILTNVGKLTDLGDAVNKETLVEVMGIYRRDLEHLRIELYMANNYVLY